MITWYIKYNKKFYIVSMIGMLIIAVVLFYIYFPKYTLFAVYAFLMMLLICYVDTITQIRRYLENNNAKAWIVEKWQLQDAITYTIGLAIIVGLGNIVVQLSPPNIPGMRTHFTTLVVFIFFAIGKWLRYFEFKREMRASKIV
ncbi:hypothetical protein ACMGE9_03670 [Macrococcus sp. EM39E]|uniref:hypothetical protein n=1 Tax=Macrococcus animalis TaxID=3395467 RepID=UPI0039BDC9B5